jgi:hypothetical protein
MACEKIHRAPIYIYRCKLPPWVTKRSGTDEKKVCYPCGRRDRSFFLDHHRSSVLAHTWVLAWESCTLRSRSTHRRPTSHRVEFSWTDAITKEDQGDRKLPRALSSSLIVESRPQILSKTKDGVHMAVSTHVHVVFCLCLPRRHHGIGMHTFD